MKIGIRFDFKKVSGSLESLESLEVLGTINICMCIYIHTYMYARRVSPDSSSSNVMFNV